MRGVVVLGVLVGTVGAILAPSAAAAGDARSGLAPAPALLGTRGTPLEVSLPATATLGRQFPIRVKLSRAVPVAAFETAVLANSAALEVASGIPGNGKGRMLDPAISASATRVGYYGGSAPGTTRDLIDILVTPTRSGLIQIRLALPLGVDAAGAVRPLRYATRTYTVRVGASTHVWRPTVAAAKVALHPHGALHHDTSRDGSSSRADLYGAVVAWDSTAANSLSAGVTGKSGDVDGDGFTTVRDLQLLDRRATTAVPALPSASALAPTKIWTVDTTSDALDAAPGNGICAIAGGGCSLRAAIDEANRHVGDDLIQFNIPGGAPQTIQLTSTLTQINATGGGLEIDGYSEPGAHANTDPLVSNALPGIVINGGWSSDTKAVSLMITSSNNIVQGLAFNVAGRGIDLLGPTAQNNTIVGNFFGMNATGAFATGTSGYAAINVDGAAHNVIGTPALADRNVIAGFFTGINHVSPGASYNVEQNNLIGFSPDATRVNGPTNDDVDYNVGPQHNLLGGLGERERNVLVAGGNDGVEYSHGYSTTDSSDTSIQYQVNYNTAQGNYIGFAPDGHFEYRFTPAQGRVDEQDGSGVNIVDVANGNVVEGNWIAAHANGVQIAGRLTSGNVIRGNHIGISPLGTPAYIGYSGVSIRLHATNEVVTGNDIHNTGQRSDQLPAPPPADPNLYGCIDNTLSLPKGCSAGIRVDEDDNVGNAITQNTFENIGNGIGIDLAPLGVVNPNDVGDADTGANTKLNSPVITSPTVSAISGTACAGCLVEVDRSAAAVGANGVASAYLGTVTADATGNWSLPVALAVGDVVSTIATDAASNSSEESAAIAATPDPVLAPPIVVAPAAPSPAPSPPADAPVPAPGHPAVVPTGELAVFLDAPTAYTLTVDGKKRVARLGAFTSAHVSDLAPGAHTITLTTLGTKKTKRFTRVVQVVSKKLALTVASRTGSGLKLRSSSLASTGLVVLNVTSHKVALRLDGKGATHTVASAPLVRTGLKAGSHTVRASVAARQLSSTGPKRSISTRVTVAKSRFGVVLISSDGSKLHSSVLTVPAG